jgi:hypothetical protein
MNGIGLAEIEQGPPRGDEAPTLRELFAMGVMGLDLRRAGRVTLMNQIGQVLNIPVGGWTHGLSRLFDGQDIRLVGLLRRLAQEKQAASIATNLGQAVGFTSGNAMLALVTVAREHHSALTAHGDGSVNSFKEGGLDFLWDEKSRLGLPGSITKNWRPAPREINHETGNEVHPALIRARDQMIVYSAQINARFEGFKSHLRTELGPASGVALAHASRVSLMGWRSYSFLAPGGRPFNPTFSIGDQSGQSFGCRTTFGYIRHKASEGSHPGAVDLEQVIKDSQLNVVEWVRIAKARTAEALFLERLLKTA